MAELKEIAEAASAFPAIPFPRSGLTTTAKPTSFI